MIDLTALRAFLAYFPQQQKSTVANLFLRPVRRGIASPEGVRAAVYAELRDSIDRATRYGSTNERDQGILDQMRRDYDGSLDFARWAIAYEKLTPAQKQAIKNGNAANAISSVMDREEPTEKQRAYLRNVGYAGPIYSKKFASSLIDIYTRGGRVDMSGAA